MPRGFGRGYRWMYWLTGLPGWARGAYGLPYAADVLYPYAPPMWAPRPYSGPYGLTPEEELRMLEEELSYLESQKDDLEQEIDELKKEIERRKKGGD
jgi:hypothetical protein